MTNSAPDVAVSHDPAETLRATAQHLMLSRPETSHSNAVARVLAAETLLLIAEQMQTLTPRQAQSLAGILAHLVNQTGDHLAPSFWYTTHTILAYQMRQQISFLERRLQGNYYTDPYGTDPELAQLLRPLLRFMYRYWWRISAEGLEHVPARGRALLVSNHSGVLPWDGAMIGTALFEHHPSARFLRNLYLTWFRTAPFLGAIFTSLGQVPGTPENAIRLLEDDEIVCTFPEGLKGVAKLYRDRYRLARFGRGGFVKAALQTGAPIIPVAVIGAEEIYPMFVNVPAIAHTMGLPFFPLTPFFPWLGPFGLIPLPSRWSITFCAPIPTAHYGANAAHDPLTVFALSEQVRDTIQQTIDRKLAERRSVFW